MHTKKSLENYEKNNAILKKKEKNDVQTDAEMDAETHKTVKRYIVILTSTTSKQPITPLQ